MVIIRSCHEIRYQRIGRAYNSVQRRYGYLPRPDEPTWEMCGRIATGVCAESDGGRLLWR